MLKLVISRIINLLMLCNVFLTLALKDIAVEYGDLIVCYLKQMDIDFVFGIPGGNIEPLFNALARCGNPRIILSRHETGAAFMADGYFRESKKLGVCCATSGPGATNLFTGVSGAYINQIPMLVITAQTPLPSLGKGGFQESSCTSINTIAMFSSCTRYNSFVSHALQLEMKLISALNEAFGEKPGPVHLGISPDVLSQKLPASKCAYDVSCLIRPSPVCRDDATIEQVYSELSRAETGVFVIGQGCERAVEYVLELAEKKRWNFVTTPPGKGLVSGYHPLNKGVVGLGGHQSAREALLEENASVIVAVGCTMDESDSQSWDQETVLTERLIHVNQHRRYLARTPVARLNVHAQPEDIMKEMASRFSAAKCITVDPCHSRQIFPEPVPDRTRPDYGPVNPETLFSIVHDKSPADTRLVLDAGNSLFWGIHCWKFKMSGKFTGNLLYADTGFAAMGWAMGAAIGCALASRDAAVVCFTGDGSVLMNGQEMTVAVKERLNILFVILNDSALGTVRHGQILANAEPVAFELPPVNFAEMASSQGIPARRIATHGALSDFDFKKHFTGSGPMVLDVVTDPEAVPPIDTRMRMLHSNNLT